MRWFWLPLVAAACGDNLDAPTVDVETPLAPTCDEADVAGSLGGIANVSSVLETPCGDYVSAGARCFVITFDQAIHHDRDDSATFPQRLFLAHRGCDRPTIVADWGYSNDIFFDDELTSLYQTNSLWIEHRYQGQSVPDETAWDWTALTIENGARDMHEVIAQFRTHYGGRFVSTGASKGGITATYHRYFFPNDVDGAIPYVAPASRARIDPAYQTNLDTVLPEPCAQRIRDAQVAALTTRRPAMLQRMTAVSGAGAESIYLEYMARSLDWVFWQYYGVGNCSRVPTTTSTDAAFFTFLQNFSGLSFDAPARTDERSDGALYYEWLTEQGFALQIGAHVQPHLTEPTVLATMEDDFVAQFPDVALPVYDGRITDSVRRFARNHATDVLFIYGQYDPWSGGAMDAPIKDSSARFFVPNATHGAQISALAERDRTDALAIASRLIGHEPLASKRDAARAGDVRQMLLDRQMQRERAVELRMKLRSPR